MGFVRKEYIGEGNGCHKGIYRRGDGCQKGIYRRGNGCHKEINPL
jgi:hypothetical protein